MMDTTQKLDHLALDIVLPWHEHEEQKQRFIQQVKRIVVPFMLLLVAIPFMPDFAPQEEAEKKVITKLVLDQPAPEPEPVIEQAPEQEKPKPAKAKAEKAKPQKTGNPDARPDLQALTQQLSALRSSANSAKRQKKNVLVAKSGKVQKSSRSLLGQKNAVTTSAGLKSSDLTVDTQGALLAEHQSGDIDSPVSEIVLPTEEQYYADPKQESRRDTQSIRRTLERHKGAVYALYTKALRDDPDLNGRFIFEFIVLPNGDVSALKLKVSELDNPALEQKMLDKIRGIKFGAQDVIATAVKYTFTFVPS